jgi:hypothetical protein
MITEFVGGEHYFITVYIQGKKSTAIELLQNPEACWTVHAWKIHMQYPRLEAWNTANNNSVRLLKNVQAFGSFNLLRNLPEFFQKNFFGFFSGIFRNIFRKRPSSYSCYKYALNCDFVISIDFWNMIQHNRGTIMSKKKYKNFPHLGLNLPPLAS